MSSEFVTKVVVSENTPSIKNVLHLNPISKELFYNNVPINSTFYNVEKIHDYFYSLEVFGALNYELGLKYCEKLGPTPSMCSAVRSGNFLGRNFDWYYNDNATFVVKTKRNCGRFATIGVAGFVRGLTETLLSTEYPVDLFSLTPFLVVDVINENGVVVENNIVPSGDAGYTTGTIPTVECRHKISGLMLPRFIADYAASASQIIDYIQKYVSIYNPSAEELHFMVADKDHTYILEILHNELYILETGNSVPSIMTNFYMQPCIEGESFNPWNTTQYGMGIERFFDIQNSLPNRDVASVVEMLGIMTNVNYTKAYDLSIPWNTEFTGETKTFSKLTVQDAKDHPEKFNVIRKYVKNLYDHRDRSRGTETWQTVHTSVYDISRKSLGILTQECSSDKLITFNL